MRRACVGASWRRGSGTAPRPPATPAGPGAATRGAEKWGPNPASPLTPHAVILGAQVSTSGPHREPGVAGLRSSRMSSLQTAGCLRHKGFRPGRSGEGEDTKGRGWTVGDEAG